MLFLGKPKKHEEGSLISGTVRECIRNAAASAYGVGAKPANTKRKRGVCA